MGNQQDWFAKPVDQKLAIAIRFRRVGMAIELKELANRVGVSETEMENYERAQQPISYGRLALIAAALDWHPYDFFGPGTIDPPSVFNPNILELARLYNGIKDPALKQELLTAARNISLKEKSSKENR